MDYRVASGTGSDGFTMSINGEVFDTQTVENTGGWQNWVTQSSPEFNLTAGQHTVRFDFIGGGINFNYFELNSPLFEIFLEAEMYFSPDCAYYVFLKNNKPAFANEMTTDGIAFFNQSFQQVGAEVRLEAFDISASSWRLAMPVS